MAGVSYRRDQRDDISQVGAYKVVHRLRPIAWLALIITEVPSKSVRYGSGGSYDRSDIRGLRAGVDKVQWAQV